MKILTPIVFAALMLINASPMKAQQISPSTPPPPPPPEIPAAPAELPPAPPEPVFDPLHAERSIEVGTFYLKKGNYDAAIDRFEEAARYQPKLARPWMLLGETFEKKRDNVHALEAYNKYLEVFPGAPDAARVQ